ncbi:hypothetical protein WJX72_000367 [[Myrmecia] bisecta]|uniref:Uncharacterized protein n=1 Tax=[Myrmecia] bisecta TaxID=41462 RepID=A0AAW1Q9I1_9CHLO
MHEQVERNRRTLEKFEMRDLVDEAAALLVLSSGGPLGKWKTEDVAKALQEAGLVSTNSTLRTTIQHFIDKGALDRLATDYPVECALLEHYVSGQWDA